MNCKEVNKELIFYIENSLSKEKSKAIKNHIDICENCSQLYNELNKSFAIIENEKITKTDSFFYTRLSEKIKQIDKPKEKQIWIKSNQVYLQAIAASIAIFLSIYSGILLGSNERNQNNIGYENMETNNYELFAESYNLEQNSESTYEMNLLDAEE